MKRGAAVVRRHGEDALRRQSRRNEPFRFRVDVGCEGVEAEVGPAVEAAALQAASVRLKEMLTAGEALFQMQLTNILSSLLHPKP